jgi:hypothetical protein
MKQIKTPRDILLFDTGPGGVLASAVDSCGGIGQLEGDTLRADPVIVGDYTARVALLEVLAAGALPVFASAAVSSGPDTAKPLISGIKKALGASLPLAISTEKNMPAPMTALGVTVTGFCPKNGLRIARAEKGDVVYCAGLPLVGAETLLPDAVLFGANHLTALLALPNVHSLLPVGSRGVAAEAMLLAAESGLSAALDPDAEINLEKSAGPATCAVFAARGRVRPDIGLPVTQIGVLL